MGEIEVQIKNLTFGLKDRFLFSLESMVISQSSRIFISGPTGSGKTSFARWLSGAVTQQYAVNADYFITDSSPLMPEEGDICIREAFHPVYVRQNPYQVFHPYFSIRHHFNDVFESVQTSEIRNLEDVYSILTHLGISFPSEILSRRVSEISQGEAQRCAVVLAMIRPSGLIILDEVTSSIDRKNSHNLLKFIFDFCSRNSKGIIFISHDSNWLDVFDMVHYEITASKSMEISRSVSRQCPDMPHIQNTKGDKLIEIVDLGVFVPNTDDKKLFHLDEFHIVKNGVTGLAGTSGVGKTTLARVFLGEIPARAQQCKINGKVIDTLENLPEGVKIRYLPQSVVTSFNPVQTIRVSLREICKVNNTSIAIIENLAVSFDLRTELLDKYPGELSGGEIQRAGIISILLACPDLIILDESFSSVHSGLRNEIWHGIRLWQRSNASAILLISHDTKWLDCVSDRVYYLQSL